MRDHLTALATRLAADASDASQATPSDSPTSDVEQTVDAVATATADVLGTLLRVGGGVLAGIVVAFLVVVTMRTLGRHRSLYLETARFCRTPLYATFASVGAFLGAQLARAELTSEWRDLVLHTLVIAMIVAGTWLLARFLKAVEATVVGGVRAGGDQGRANRVTTQAQILRRVTEVVVIICGAIGVIMTFPSARVAMASLVASAGLVSVIAGLAAQSTLGNVFAGLQLATTDAIRVDDTVEVSGEFGQIEEITLTYVVVRIWDERRLILPSTYFTANPFTNWSRRTHQMLGVVTFEVDWRVPIAQMRAELARVVAASPQWDGRACALVVTETSAQTVTARATVSAANGDDVWALRCHVREELIAWLQREAPYALPRTRVEVDHLEVAQDPAPEQVARLAEELAGLRGPGGQPGAGGGSRAGEPGKDDGAAAAGRGKAAPGRSGRVAGGTARTGDADGADDASSAGAGGGGRGGAEGAAATGAGEATAVMALPADPIEAARMRAVSSSAAAIRRARRDKVRRRRILARDGAAPEAIRPARETNTATGALTTVISTKDQQAYLERMAAHDAVQKKGTAAVTDGKPQADPEAPERP